MREKKIYSAPEIEIDRSVFESLAAISADEWIGWDDTDIDETTVTGAYSEESSQYLSAFAQDGTVANDDFNWNW